MRILKDVISTSKKRHFQFWINLPKWAKFSLRGEWPESFSPRAQTNTVEVHLSSALGKGRASVSHYHSSFSYSAEDTESENSQKTNYSVKTRITQTPEENQSRRRCLLFSPHRPNLPPRGHPWLQEGQPQPLDKLHAKLPQQGLVALGESAPIKALEHSVGCRWEHAVQCRRRWHAPLKWVNPTGPREVVDNSHWIPEQDLFLPKLSAENC